MTVKTYSSFPDALEALRAALARRRFSPSEYHIVLTPDRYTLAAETALFTGGGALDCEVLTLSRLCRRVLGAGKILSREGGVMLTARAIAAVRHGFTYYGHASSYGEFAREVYETLLQIGASGADVACLAAPGATGEKLHDLALIKAEYDRLKSDMSDPPDRLHDLIAAVKDSPLVTGSHFYAIGYKDATKLNRDVFGALAAAARSFDFYDAMPPEPRPRMTVYEAPDAVTQCKAIARRIREYVIKGGRYGDVAVVAPEPRALERILREYDIDFYSDRKTALFDTPPLAFLYGLYRYSRGDADRLPALAKNPFSGCDRTDAERLELYVDSHGAYSEPDEPAAAAAYRRVAAAVDAFTGAGAFADAVEHVIETVGFEATSGRLFGGETDLVAPILHLTELLRRYGAAGDAFDADAAAFFAAARSVTVNSLPRTVDRVWVCDPRALRLSRPKKLYIADFAEGVLPAVTSDGGLLSDAELVATGGAIEPTAREMNRRDRDELAAVIANAGDVFCAYATADGARRAAFMAECAVALDELSYTEECYVLKNSPDAGLIASVACTTAAARELAARRLSIYADSVAAAVGRSDNTSPPFVPHADVHRRALSVSELTHWFGCPYRRFLTDSVGLKERRRGEMGAADFGVVMHEFMQKWIVKTPLDPSEKAVAAIVEPILDRDGLLTGPRNRPQRDRIIADACDYAEINARVVEAGDYVPDPTLLEHSFGGEIRLGEEGIPFVGTIDRVDTSGGRARVIDYKTGNKHFEMSKCLDGRDMQLPLYAAVLKDKAVTGMFYLPLRPKYSDGDKLVGCMIRDVNVALGYDRGLAGGERSDIIPARLRVTDGDIEGFVRPSAKLMEENDFYALIDTCVETASLAADEINSGYIERTPADGECLFCPFGGLCAHKLPRGEQEEDQ